MKTIFRYLRFLYSVFIILLINYIYTLPLLYNCALKIYIAAKTKKNYQNMLTQFSLVFVSIPIAQDI